MFRVWGFRDFGFRVLRVWGFRDFWFRVFRVWGFRVDASGLRGAGTAVAAIAAMALLLQ